MMDTYAYMLLPRDNIENNRSWYCDARNAARETIYTCTPVAIAISFSLSVKVIGRLAEELVHQ